MFYQCIKKELIKSNYQQRLGRPSYLLVMGSDDSRRLASQK